MCWALVEKMMPAGWKRGKERQMLSTAQALSFEQAMLSVWLAAAVAARNWSCCRAVLR